MSAPIQVEIILNTKDTFSPVTSLIKAKEKLGLWVNLKWRQNQTYNVLT